MGGGATLEIAHIFTHQNTYDGKVLTRVSTFLFSQPALPDPLTMPVLDEAAIMKVPLGTTPGFPTGKIGIQLEMDQKVDDLMLLFEGLRYPAKLDGTVKKELEDTFGKGKHLQWHGFSVALPPPTGSFQMSALLKIAVDFKELVTIGGKIYAGVYAVAMVFGFYTVPLLDHYALGLTTLQPDNTNSIDTSVRLRS